ncbi:hypothetical protein CAP36_12345 [Chitinophagaceae bacterium IBVUCB2]|nr:hypothetical protein CAP36_12345 [Chitinophagaceae bacterium IBVUCB2]
MDLQQRIGGKLPEIDIAGTMFFVDIRLHELRSDYQLMSRINLDNLESGANGDTYLFAFNTESKQLVNIDPKLTAWPDNVIIVEIPDEVKLDPYSFAREAGLDPLEFVKEHPIEKELKAKVIPLSETGFLEMMEKNKKAKQEKLIQQRNEGPGKRNKGNRIK